ncbi:MAG: biotin--[acetyl-CoA-carboxylase] ligase, partial [Pseudomonadota bacterium]
EVQTAGRGRLGRAWQSPTGNLYTTALMAWPHGLETALRLPFAAALAVSDAIEAVCAGATTQLKWPNDVRVAGQKLAGILIESGEGPKGRWVSVGIGINIVAVPDGVDQAAIALADLPGGETAAADHVFSALRAAFSMRFVEALEDFSRTRTAWLNRAEGLGQTLRASAAGGPVEGVFSGLGEDGALLLELPDGTEARINAGEVSLVKDLKD